MDRLISENKVLEAIDNLKANFTCYDFVTLDEVASHVKAIPSAEYETEITKYSDDEKYKALITLYFASINCEDKEKRKRYNTAIKLIEGIPSAEPKVGHWIAIDEEPHEDYECDKCGYTISTYTANIEPHTEYKYCPNCGCRMIEKQESEG